MRSFRFTILVLFFCLCAKIMVAQSALSQQQFEEDFDYLWQEVSENYAYFDLKQTDWNKVKEIYRPKIKNLKTATEFVTFLESVLGELYDFHTHLNTNTATSPYLIPTGTDVWAERKNDKAIITEVKPASNAARAGLVEGMQVVSINGIAVDVAVRGRLGKSLRKIDGAAMDWALQILLSGRRNEKRNIEVISNGKHALISIDPRSLSEDKVDSLLDYRRLEQNIGYIRINNSLGNIDLIKQFDTALADLRNTNGLILDLRDTPSGGNTTVARGIMGRFVNSETAYQKHSIPREENQYGLKRSWLELVSPRGEFIYKSPVIVLVNHWTGSMGEGIAIGMDGMKRAGIVGTEMAGLIGATSQIKLPNTKIGVSFPTEKLFHINGTPREKFIPPVYVDLLKMKNRDESDAILQVGLKTLKSIKTKNKGRYD